MLKKLSFLSAIFLVSACATQSPVAGQKLSDDASKVAINDSNSDIICKRTHKVGTNFKTTQCWTKQDYEEYQRRSREAIEKAQGSNSAPPRR